MSLPIIRRARRLAVLALTGTALGAVCVSGAASRAQETGEDDALDSIVITGDRFETPLDQVGRTVTVVTAEDIALRQQRLLVDVLEAAPGVQTIRSGSFGALSSVSIRGLPSGQTLIVQDGVVLNDPSSFNNGFDFAAFDSMDVERVEILRGAQSTLYGTDAIGGVINVITKDGREGFGGEGFVEGGSFGSVRAAASVYGGDARASGRVSVGGFTTRGFSSADEANGNTEDDGFDVLTVSGKGRASVSPSLELLGVARYQDSENEFDSFGGLGPVDGDEIGEGEELSLAGVATQKLLGDRVENRLAVTYLRRASENTTDGVTSFDALGTRFSTEYQATLRPADWIAVIAGAEYDEQESEVTVGFGGDQTIETASGFGLVQLSPLEGVTLNAGVRHDASSSFSDETTFNVSAAVTAPGAGTILRASYSEGFRAPTAGELSFNPDLFAEFSSGFDIGIEQPFASGRARASVTYFDQDIDDLIAFDLAAFTFVNIQEFSTEGVEIALDAAITDWLDFRGAYTLLDAVNVSTAIAAGGQPDNRFNAQLTARATADLTLSAGVTFNGAETVSGAPLDAYTLVNLRVEYAVSDALALFARVENATDADYQDNVGFGTAPVSAFGGLRARF